MRKILVTMILISIAVFAVLNFQSLFPGQNDADHIIESIDSKPVLVSNEKALVTEFEVKNYVPLDVAKKISFPLLFPVENFKPEMILGIPSSRLPGAPRNYRGPNEKHDGIDFYTEQCGLKVFAPADSWIIDISRGESFPDSKIRDSILAITSAVGFTPLPILENLHGGSVVLYHGLDDKGNHCYSRYSHLGDFSIERRIGDFISRGDVIGTISATGTSYNFKPEDEKRWGCHLHFEWHQMKNGKDVLLGLNERDDDLKRHLYYQLFNP